MYANYFLCLTFFLLFFFSSQVKKMRKCFFNNAWLYEDDGQRYFISEWAEEKNEYEVYCKVCLSVRLILGK